MDLFESGLQFSGYPLSDRLLNITMFRVPSGTVKEQLCIHGGYSMNSSRLRPRDSVTKASGVHRRASISSGTPRSPPHRHLLNCVAERLFQSKYGRLIVTNITLDQKLLLPREHFATAAAEGTDLTRLVTELASPISSVKKKKICAPPDFERQTTAGMSLSRSLLSIAARSGGY